MFSLCSDTFLEADGPIIKFHGHFVLEVYHFLNRIIIWMLLVMRNRFNFEYSLFLLED